jgi:hypothetical protein
MSARRRFLGALLALPAMPLVAKLPVAAPVVTLGDIVADIFNSGVRLNARLARRALVRKIRDAQARDERSR